MTTHLYVVHASWCLGALAVIRVPRRLERRATRARAVRGGQLAIAAALAFSHRAHDAQESVGVLGRLCA